MRAIKTGNLVFASMNPALKDAKRNPKSI
jgi:hypothetical protein